MKYSKIALIILLTFSSALFSNGSPHWHLDGANGGWQDEWLALKYFHHSELQRQWAWHLLGSRPFVGNENILDFGCGDGKITAEISHFIPEGHILGVDLSSAMIALANRCFSHAHYPNLSFAKTLDADFNEPYINEKYDLICSFCVFHVVPHPIQVLSHLREKLAPTGKLLLVIPAGNNPALFQAANEIFDQYGLKAPWASKDNVSKNVNMRTQDGCINCLKEAGFEPISVVVFHTPTLFFNKQELVEWMIGTLTANWQIPLEKADHFFNDLVSRMAELDRDVLVESGGYSLKLSRLEVVAQHKDK